MRHRTTCKCSRPAWWSSTRCPMPPVPTASAPVRATARCSAPGKWTKRESSRDPDVKIPAGAKVLSNFQSLTLAETYVTVGAPDRGALQSGGKGLVLVPVTHPNDLYVGEFFEFVMQYDGKPLADQKVEITEAVWTSDRKPHVETLLTDAQGHAVFKLQDAGTWVALSRYRTPAPAGAPVDEISNSTTLTFRGLDQ